jgi:hypothetical protein
VLFSSVWGVSGRRGLSEPYVVAFVRKGFVPLSIETRSLIRCSLRVSLACHADQPSPSLYYKPVSNYARGQSQGENCLTIPEFVPFFGRCLAEGNPSFFPSPHRMHGCCRSQAALRSDWVERVPLHSVGLQLFVKSNTCEAAKFTEQRSRDTHTYPSRWPAAQLSAMHCTSCASTPHGFYFHSHDDAGPCLALKVLALELVFSRLCYRAIPGLIDVDDKRMPFAVGWLVRYPFLFGRD